MMKARRSVTNTAGGSQILDDLDGTAVLGRTWSDNSSIAVLSSSTTISPISAPTKASHQPMLEATKKLAGSPSASANEFLQDRPLVTQGPTEPV